MLVHQGFGDVEELETGQMGAQTIVGIVAEDEEFAVGQTYFFHHAPGDERPLKVGPHNLCGLVYLLFGQFATVQRTYGIGEIEVSELVGEHLAFEQTAGREDSHFRPVGVGQQAVEAVGVWKHIVVHAPYPVGSLTISPFDARVEAARTAHIVLMHHEEARLGVEPFSGAIGGTVVHNDDTGQLLLLAQTLDALLEQFEAVESHYDGCYLHSVVSLFCPTFLRIITFPFSST